MADPPTIKEAFERTRKALERRPQIGQSTVVTKIQVSDGTTCTVEHKHWTFKVDIGKAQGGNDSGPGPGIMERAALGSCLAIGYATWAANMEIPIDDIKVHVESDLDARGQYDIADIPPGFKALRYRVMIQSPAPKEEVRALIDKADSLSPVLDDFKRPISVERTVEINEKAEKLNTE